jgi:lycopene cyclase domain-containing protein
MDKFTYLFLNLITVIIPLARSFEPRINFYSKWKALFKAISITALFFIVWDVCKTHFGIWGFNERYIIGIYIINLPIEEILFFVCIPFACIFIYEVLNYFVKKDYLGRYAKRISLVLALVFFLLALGNFNKAYSFWNFLFCSLFLFYVSFTNPTYMGRFYLSFAVSLFGFFFINGVLTGTFYVEEPIVWYNNNEQLGFRIFKGLFGPNSLGIPIEDVFYGLLLLLMNVVLYERFKQDVKSKLIKG